MQLELNFVCRAAAWRRIPRLSTQLKKTVGTAWKYLPARLQIPCKVAVLLTTDSEMRRFNRDFRGFDKPTNVLSFPQLEPAQLPQMGRSRGPVYLGDIALGYQYVVAEAIRDHKILINHVTHLVIHGLLHLFGYDHALDLEAGRMERLEQKIMKKLGLPDPYLDTGAAQPMEPKRTARKNKRKKPARPAK